jgi:hypothetical protein
MRIINTILLGIVFTLVASSQEFTISRSIDTLSLRDLVFPAAENQFWQTQSFPSINPADSAAMANLPAGYLRSEMLSLPSVFDNRFDLSSSLKLNWTKDDKYQLLRSALGYVLVGGEAYMVYRALQKYRYIR